MASTKEYRDFILEQLGSVEGISCRAMMGEYVLYCDGKVFGGIYDDRLLIKAFPAALALMPNAPRELPYPTGKAMLLVENVDDRSFLVSLVNAIRGELPPVKKK